MRIMKPAILVIASILVSVNMGDIIESVGSDYITLDFMIPGLLLLLLVGLWEYNDKWKEKIRSIKEDSRRRKESERRDMQHREEMNAIRNNMRDTHIISDIKEAVNRLPKTSLGDNGTKYVELEPKTRIVIMPDGSISHIAYPVNLEVHMSATVEGKFSRAQLDVRKPSKDSG